MHIGGCWYLENQVQIAWVIGSVGWFGKKCNEVDIDECWINDGDAGLFAGSRQPMKKKQIKN
jgi:hypothetical protein